MDAKLPIIIDVPSSTDASARPVLSLSPIENLVTSNCHQKVNVNGGLNTGTSRASSDLGRKTTHFDGSPNSESAPFESPISNQASAEGLMKLKLATKNF